MLQRAVNVQPTNGHYLDSLGWAYYKLGKYEEAERYLLDAVRYVSTSAVIKDHLGDLYQKLGKMALAKGAWQQALDLHPNPELAAKIKSKLAGDGKK
jgi:tetratricopeptide (TPR) repeat protein